MCFKSSGEIRLTGNFEVFALLCIFLGVNVIWLQRGSTFAFQLKRL